MGHGRRTNLGREWEGRKRIVEALGGVVREGDDGVYVFFSETKNNDCHIW
jgi:hypothetical protein